MYSSGVAGLSQLLPSPSVYVPPDATEAERAAALAASATLRQAMERERLARLPPPPTDQDPPPAPPTHLEHHLHPELLEESWQQLREAQSRFGQRAPRVSMPTGPSTLTDDTGVFDFGSVLPYIAIGAVLLLVMKMK